METRELERIQEKIKAAGERKTRAEGGIENLEAQLKKEFGLVGDAAVNAEIERLTEEERRDTERLTALETELKGLTDWGAV